MRLYLLVGQMTRHTAPLMLHIPLQMQPVQIILRRLMEILVRLFRALVLLREFKIWLSIQPPL